MEVKWEELKRSLDPMTAVGFHDLDANGVSVIVKTLRALLADVFALYLKVKGFHWHMNGRHFREYHLLLDEHAGQLFAMTDVVAERARKLGGMTLRSIGDIVTHQRLRDTAATHPRANQMLAELLDDYEHFTVALRLTHWICEQNGDVATSSFIEIWIDQSEQRSWFLREIVDHSLIEGSSPMVEDGESVN
jgi:starvation-inducible DNA-binding protein